MKRQTDPGTFLAPLPAVLVSCGDMQENNLIAIAWTGITCSRPPMTYVSVMPQRFSHHIIKEKGCFVINLVDRDLAAEMDWCGSRSGRDHDKAKELGLSLSPSPNLGCPMVDRSKLSLECRVTEIKPLGTHDMFLAEIVGVCADESLLDENGRLSTGALDTVSFLGGQYFAKGEKMDRTGFSVRNGEK